MAKKSLKNNARVTTVKKLVKKVHQGSPLGKKDDGKILPLGGRVLIKPFTKDELQKKDTAKNDFGIILPEADKKEKSEQGKVMAVGAGQWHDGKRLPMSVKVGDVVAFSKYGYDDIKVDGEELYLIKEENILAILR